MKKLLAIAMAFAMIFALAACGGGGGASAPAGDSSEANAGVAGIVFTVPDGWTTEYNEPGRYVSYKILDSDLMMGVSTFGEDDIADYNEWNDEDVDSVQDYYEKTRIKDEKTAKKFNIDVSDVKICGVDGVRNKYNTEKKDVSEISTSWLMDNIAYSVFIYNPNAFDEEGNAIEGAETVSDDMAKAYDDIVASIKPGDGTAVQKEALAASAGSLGDITYDVPEGFSVASVSDSYNDFEKEGSEISLGINMTDESMLDDLENEDGSKPESLKEYFNAEERPDEDIKEVSGYNVYVYEYPDEDGKYYNVSATFMTENAIYDIYMGSNSYDENGELKADAQELSKEDLAAFDSFIASIRKK